MSRKLEQVHIEGFLGYTDTLKPHRKASAEKILSRPIRYNDKVYPSTVDMLCSLLLSGYTLDKELEKDNFIYQFVTPGDSNVYLQLKKTEYDFVSYLLDRGITAKETMLSYVETEKAVAERERKKAEELERKKAEEEQAEKQEQQEWEDWMNDEVAHLAEKYPEQTEVARTVFVSEYGECPEVPRSWWLIPCILHFDNKKCREELCQRLNTSNPASRKVFTCLTGLKLPGTNKGTQEYLETITSADFGDPVPYVPRSPKKEAQKQKFFVMRIGEDEKHEETYEWAEVLAEPYTKYGVEMFFQQIAPGKWRLSEVTSGMAVATGTKAECKQELAGAVKRYGLEKFTELCKQTAEMVQKHAGRPNPLFEKLNEDEENETDEGQAGDVDMFSIMGALFSG